MKRPAETIEIICDKGGERMDIFLSSKLEGYSRSYIQKLISQGLAGINGVPAKANTRLKTGDIVSVIIPEVRKLENLAEDIPLDIIYEDADIIVINKPKGLVVHPAAGNYSHTLVNALLHYCPEELSDINGVIRPGIVHRLDKDTSGLLVAAKNNTAHQRLSEQLKEHKIKRIYYAVTDGVINTEKGRIDAPIGRHPTDRKSMSVNVRNGREAVTHFTVLERFKDTSLVRLELETGRTHQIRVHLEYIGYPVLGDAVYGRKGANKKYGLTSQALHAKELVLVHPSTGKLMEFESPLPDYFEALLRKLGET